jgi:hypothetical protein
MTTDKPPKKRKIKIEIDFENGEIAGVEAHSPGAISEKQLTQTEIDQLLLGPYTLIGQLLFTHSSPGCVTYILGGFAVTICYP